MPLAVRILMGSFLVLIEVPGEIRGSRSSPNARIAHGIVQKTFQKANGSLKKRFPWISKN